MKRKEKKCGKKNKCPIRGLQDKFSWPAICAAGVSEGEKTEGKTRKIVGEIGRERRQNWALRLRGLGGDQEALSSRFA